MSPEQRNYLLQRRGKVWPEKCDKCGVLATTWGFHKGKITCVTCLHSRPNVSTAVCWIDEAADIWVDQCESRPKGKRELIVIREDKP